MQGIQALGGLRGEQGGVSFDIRAAHGDGPVDMQIALAGVTLKSRPGDWHVHCYGENVHVYFGGSGAAAHATTSGATLDRTYSNSLEGRSADADHEMPYCSFETWRAWGGEEDFRVWTPMHR